MKGLTDDTSRGRHDVAHRIRLGFTSRRDARRHWFNEGTDEAAELVELMARGAFPNSAEARRVFAERINSDGAVKDMIRRAQRDI